MHDDEVPCRAYNVVCALPYVEPIYGVGKQHSDDWWKALVGVLTSNSMLEYKTKNQGGVGGGYSQRFPGGNGAHYQVLAVTSAGMAWLRTDAKTLMVALPPLMQEAAAKQARQKASRAAFKAGQQVRACVLMHSLHGDRNNALVCPCRMGLHTVGPSWYNCLVSHILLLYACSLDAYAHSGAMRLTSGMAALLIAIHTTMSSPSGHCTSHVLFKGDPPVSMLPACQPLHQDGCKHPARMFCQPCRVSCCACSRAIARASCLKVAVSWSLSCRS